LRASDAINPAALTRHVAAAVREAGALALKSFKSPIKSWFKEGDSPVSEVDIAVDALLRERLEATGLACGWLSEETEDDPARLSAQRVWIVDPIDGTRGFLAAAGGGATHNGSAMVATAGTTLAGARVAGPERRLARLAPFDIIGVPKVHSLALRIARVAQGQLDLALAGPNSHDWDLAAADLLVHEAHGALTTLGGETLIYNQPSPTHGALFAAGRARHQALSELMREGRVAFR
jgi:myo-inositol-1(or 4)-monophosphatase